MSPGGNQAQQGESQLPVRRVLLQPGGVHVPLQVINPHQGQFQGQRERLRRVHPHHQRPRQARPVGDRHRVHVVPIRPRLLQSLVDDGPYRDHVLTGGQFRHYAAVGSMYGYLGGDDVGQQLPAVFHHRHRRLVAGCFYA